MVERAGVDMDPVDALPPRSANRFRQKPAPVTLARQRGDQADEGKLALMWFTKIEFEDSDLAPGFVNHCIELDLRVLDDRGEVRIVHHQAREPQPWRSHQTEQLAVMRRLRNLDALQREF